MIIEELFYNENTMYLLGRYYTVDTCYKLLLFPVILFEDKGQPKQQNITNFQVKMFPLFPSLNPSLIGSLINSSNGK